MGTPKTGENVFLGALAYRDILHVHDIQFSGKALFVSPSGSDSNNGLDTWGNAKATIQAAVAAASAGDVVCIAPGAYDETVVVNKSLTLIGVGPLGSVFIEPSTAEAEGMQVTADDVTLVNVGVAGDDDGDYALNLHAVSRFRAYGCKFEGTTGVVVLVDGTATDQTADALFQDCEFARGGSGVLFDDSAFGYPTQIRLVKCWFHNLTAVGIGLAAGGGVVNLEVVDSIFDNAEDGTAPTDYIKVDRDGDTGIISGCRFATATNEADVLTIAAGIMWVVNATEAGWTSARPA
jgi:hypothetical protein